MRRLWRVADGAPIASFLAIGRAFDLLVSPEGRVWTPHNPSIALWPSSPGLEATLVYIVQTASGQQTLTPLEFANRYGWQNDPSQVRLK